MTEYAPAAIRAMFDTVKASIPQAILAGIVGDSAHTYGYHRGRNYVSSSDYSVQKPPDKKGNGEAASAIDLSWSQANWQYTVSQRLLNAKNDSRMYPIREFFGSVDGRNVVGWDYYGGYSVTSDSSHLWHIHISVLREYADNTSALQGVAQVLIGGSGGGGPTPPQPGGDWFDMASQTDLENAVRKVLNEGTGAGQTSWAKTCQAQFSGIQTGINKLNSLLSQTNKAGISAGAADALSKGTAYGTTSWGQTNQGMYNRTGDIINRLNAIQSDINELLEQAGATTSHAVQADVEVGDYQAPAS
jgi:hypothetical protein